MFTYTSNLQIRYICAVVGQKEGFRVYLIESINHFVKERPTCLDFIRVWSKMSRI